MRAFNWVAGRLFAGLDPWWDEETKLYLVTLGDGDGCVDIEVSDEKPPRFEQVTEDGEAGMMVVRDATPRLFEWEDILVLERSGIEPSNSGILLHVETEGEGVQPGYEPAWSGGWRPLTGTPNLTSTPRLIAFGFGGPSKNMRRAHWFDGLFVLPPGSALAVFEIGQSNNIEWQVIEHMLDGTVRCVGYPEYLAEHRRPRTLSMSRAAAGGAKLRLVRNGER